MCLNLFLTIILLFPLELLRWHLNIREEYLLFHYNFNITCGNNIPYNMWNALALQPIPEIFLGEISSLIILIMDNLRVPKFKVYSW